jgi:hypothetical protein
MARDPADKRSSVTRRTDCRRTLLLLCAVGLALWQVGVTTRTPAHALREGPGRAVEGEAHVVLHVVLTSHLDPGWLLPFSTYAKGAGGRIVRSAILSALCSESARFSLSDMAFLLAHLEEHGEEAVAESPQGLADACAPFARALGTDGASALTRAHTVSGSSRLPTWTEATQFAVESSCLELTSGSYVQHDEALTPPSIVRGQVRLGRRGLARVLLPRGSNATANLDARLLEAVPSLTIAYQNDAFGHSGATPILLAAEGFAQLILNRLPFRDKLGRKRITRALGERALSRGEHSILAASEALRSVMRFERGRPSVNATSGALFARWCGMQGRGADRRLFITALHEHYSTPPVLRSISKCGAVPPSPVQVRAWAAALLDEGASIAAAYCSGYPIRSPAGLAPGHALLLVGDDFAHADGDDMACAMGHIRMAIRGTKTQSRLDVRVSTFRSYLEASRAQHELWGAVAAEAWGGPSDGPAVLEVPDGSPLGDDAFVDLAADVNAAARADSSSTPGFPGMHTLLPYTDRPFANVWSGFYGTAPTLKLALVTAAAQHAAALRVADGIVANATASAGQPFFVQLCSSSGKPRRGSSTALEDDIAVMDQMCDSLGDASVATCPIPVPGERTQSGGTEIFNPVDARAARVYVGFHHDGMTGTSRPEVLQDYHVGAEIVSRHADACLRWAALIAPPTRWDDPGRVHPGETSITAPSTRGKAPRATLEGSSVSIAGGFRLTLATTPVSTVQGWGGGAYVLRMPTAAFASLTAAALLGPAIRLCAARRGKAPPRVHTALALLAGGCAGLLASTLLNPRVTSDQALRELMTTRSVGAVAAVSAAFAVLPAAAAIFEATAILTAAQTIAAHPDTFVRPVAPSHASIQTHALATSVSLSYGSGGDCELDLQTEASNQGSIAVTVSCTIPVDTELWLRLEGPNNASPANVLTPVQWAEGDLFAARGDASLTSAVATAAGFLAARTSSLEAWGWRPRAHRLCIHDGIAWIGRPSLSPGTDLPAAVFPLLSAATPCTRAADGSVRGSWSVLGERPGGVAWALQSRWAGAPTALLLLGRRTSVDDEKGLGAGTPGDNTRAVLQRLRLQEVGRFAAGP